MTYGFIKPEVEARLPSEPKKLMRKRVDIPGMVSRKGLNARFTKEQVVEAILRKYRGETCTQIAASIGAHPMTVRHWVDGTIRARAGEEAARRWAAEQKAKHR